MIWILGAKSNTFET